MVETIVHVSHSLGICTVAESVETAQQVKILRELGADVGQGYFFAKPLAVEDALTLTTMDPLPVFPLTDLDTLAETEASRRDDDADDRLERDDDDDESDTSPYTGPGPGIAAEVMGALADAHAADDSDEESDSERSDFVVSDDMHLEAADLSLVSKRGRLLASFRKGKSS